MRACESVACEIACVWKCALVKLYACESTCVGKCVPVKLHARGRAYCMRVKVRACEIV